MLGKCKDYEEISLTSWDVSLSMKKATGAILEMKVMKQSGYSEG